MMKAFVAPSGQNVLKASKVKAHVANLSKQVPYAKAVGFKGNRRRFMKQYKLRILKQFRCVQMARKNRGSLASRGAGILPITDQVAYAARLRTA